MEDEPLILRIIDAVGGTIFFILVGFLAVVCIYAAIAAIFVAVYGILDLFGVV